MSTNKKIKIQVSLFPFLLELQFRMSFLSKMRPNCVMKFSNRAVSTANRLRGFDAPTVWQVRLFIGSTLWVHSSKYLLYFVKEFTPLANAHKAVNLGQGFPDWESPVSECGM